MENVAGAQDFVGNAIHHCGPFYLWGNAVPILLPRGITKGVLMGSGNGVKGLNREEKKAYRKKFPMMQVGGKSKERAMFTAAAATIPPELSNTVADYIERIIQSEN